MKLECIYTYSLHSRKRRCCSEYWQRHDR